MKQFKNKNIACEIRGYKSNRVYSDVQYIQDLPKEIEIKNEKL
jgi:hypothetical protein